MAEFKYIMMRVTYPVPRDIPIIFPDFLVHDQVYQALKELGGEQMRDATAISAGFTQLLDLECYGKSSTLDIESRKEDDSIILSYLYLHGLVNDD